jgi:hypothetical protein
LTKEYELAKVQEAKEIPTVKVLDDPNIPDKQSFPPRLLIILLGTLLAVGLGTGWVFVKRGWILTNPADPRKMFAQEVLTTVRARIPKFARNGSLSHFGDEPMRGWVPSERDDDAGSH